MSPIVPAPMITTFSAGPRWSPRRTAWTPLANGSASAPIRALVPAGSARRLATGTRTRSAKAPGKWIPISVRTGQTLSRPARHNAQCPQDSIGLTVTCLPSHSASAGSPTSSTVPENSCPITRGGTRLSMCPR